MIAPVTAMPTKAALRAGATARRDTITTAEREAASVAIADRVSAVAGEAHPRVIAAYMPIWSEVDPLPIIAWAFDNDIAVVLPAVIDSTTFVYRRYWRDDELVSGRWGTRSPSVEAEIADPDLVISPVLAFDRTGTRLGYGGGFYDRAIARLRADGAEPLLVGVAFAAQEVPAIPTERHDERMHLIVTERETLDFRRETKG